MNVTALESTAKVWLVGGVDRAGVCCGFVRAATDLCDGVTPILSHLNPLSLGSL